MLSEVVPGVKSLGTTGVEGLLNLQMPHSQTSPLARVLKVLYFSLTV